MNATNPPPLQWWGGVECTINRVGDRFFSQLARNGHRSRLSDLDQFAALGLKRLRFPILWEELAADSPGSIHWELVEPHLQRMRELGLQPIAGLLHHGSGPRYTHLLDPDFPQKLATFAQAVAERFPWIDAFTPVNEPLTTARFSALYGHWFPHARDGLSFARAFLNQLCATVLAMRAIREVNPRAALVQTEDLGKTFSSPRLQYQAEFENERRWLTWDLLCGRVHHEHPMWHYLRWLGAEEREISFFAEEPCPPQVIGVNHYITSERFLDEHLHPYPRETYGGNGRDRYADVAAVRARAEGIAGPETLLRETCARYAIPVAVTEAHLGCTRDEQMRWLHEIWRAAESLRGARHNVCAITAWSLLGAFDWDSLLTRADNHYEPGVFDVRSSPPRPTAIARMLGSLANGKNFSHPVISSPGWWRRSIRLESSGECPTRSGFMAGDEAPCEGSPLLITGAAGRLGRAFQWAANLRALAYCAFTRQELDLTSSEAIARVLDQVKPWSVINCAGFSSVDAAERKASACILVNTTAAELLARACAERDIPLLTFSSDYVFDGDKHAAYVESDTPAALNVYGESKALAEAAVLAAHEKALVLRCGKIFAPLEPVDFLRDQLEALARGERVRVPRDIRFSAVHLVDLVTATLDLLIDEERGLWHLANSGSVTPEELLVRAAALTGLDSRLIEGVPNWSLARPALRPLNRALASERGELLPPLEDALQRFAADVRPLLDCVSRIAAAQ